jgi:hypothetical protein
MLKNNNPILFVQIPPGGGPKNLHRIGSLAKQQVNIAEVRYKLIAKNLSVGDWFIKRSFRIGRFRAYNGSKVNNIILWNFFVGCTFCQRY